MKADYDTVTSNQYMHAFVNEEAHENTGHPVSPSVRVKIQPSFMYTNKKQKHMSSTTKFSKLLNYTKAVIFNSKLYLRQSVYGGLC